MKRFLCLLSTLLALFLSVSAQIIVTSPEFPTENDKVTIIYDAPLGIAGSKNFIVSVYAHIGVITN